MISSMKLVGRTAEAVRLATALDRPEACWVALTGVRGSGKSALLEAVLRGRAHLHHRARPLPDLAQRARLAAALRPHAETVPDADVEDAAPTWTSLFRTALKIARRVEAPWVLAVDDVHRLREARSRFAGPLAEILRTAHAEEVGLKVVLVAPACGLPVDLGPEPGPSEHVELGPLAFRDALELLPGSRPEDLLQAYGVFGGLPSVLARLDRGAALGTNVRRLLLGRPSPLGDVGGEWLERDVQTPARYYAILAALADGEGDWSRVRAGVPELTSSGQVAPYLKRLAELGLVRVRRSLDATPGSRARRYALSDPFFASWLRYSARVLPEPASNGMDDYGTVVRPTLEAHLRRVFPLICRQHMRLDPPPILGSGTREVGSLWGGGYDIAVAGILRSGSAFYGACLWNLGTEDAPLASLDRQIRETRYGFGRERRIRIVFVGFAPPRSLLREVARRHDALLIGPEQLASR